MFDPLSNHMLISIMLTILGIAVLSDLQNRIIPNQLVVFGLLLGLTGQTLLAGGGGLTIAASGALVGLFCLLPFYISRGMGAGDVKLMAMCGAFLGPLHAVVASVATLLVGGILGIAWFLWQIIASGEHYVTNDGQPASIPSVRHQAKPTSAIPYSLAIVGGVLVTLKAAPTILPILIGGISS